MRTSTYVYVDGFNLYYGAVRDTPFRWLDLSKLCQLMLPKHDVRAIKYFSARVKPRPGDPSQPARQQAYFRALRTLPHCSIILGHFLSHKVQMPLVHPREGQKYALVVKTEEKGSDVNLATHLLCDGYEGAFDAAVIVSNDSDLAEPVRIVSEKLGKAVGILNPHKHPSKELSKYATFLKQIRKGVLQACQFPDILVDEHGELHKPDSW